MESLKVVKDKKNGMNSFQRFLNEEDGMGVVEMILIIIVLIGLVILFRDSLRSLVESILKTVTDNAKSVEK